MELEAMALYYVCLLYFEIIVIIVTTHCYYVVVAFAMPKFLSLCLPERNISVFISIQFIYYLFSVSRYFCLYHVTTISIMADALLISKISVSYLPRSLVLCE